MKLIDSVTSSKKNYFPVLYKPRLTKYPQPKAIISYLVAHFGKLLQDLLQPLQQQAEAETLQCIGPQTAATGRRFNTGPQPAAKGDLSNSLKKQQKKGMQNLHMFRFRVAVCNLSHITTIIYIFYLLITYLLSLKQCCWLCATLGPTD